MQRILTPYCTAQYSTKFYGGSDDSACFYFITALLYFLWDAPHTIKLSCCHSIVVAASDKIPNFCRKRVSPLKAAPISLFYLSFPFFFLFFVNCTNSAPTNHELVWLSGESQNGTKKRKEEEREKDGEIGVNLGTWRVVVLSAHWFKLIRGLGQCVCYVCCSSDSIDICLKLLYAMWCMYTTLTKI